MALQALRGTTDLLPDEVSRWIKVEQTARRLARIYGYSELRTPIIEEAALFLRSIGETTDIVQKEMFRFIDRGGHDIVLRPEGTASIIRAYLERNLHKTQGFSKLFYMGPMFRSERPQAGRMRQFHQYGVEAIGSFSPLIDVEVIVLCVAILKACGVNEASVWLSSMGCREDRKRSGELLRKSLDNERSQLCENCQSRFDRNIFRVLDCKNRNCQTIVADQIKKMERHPDQPPTPFVLCEACITHFNEVRQGLRNAKVAFDDTKLFARGLDYYTRTVFEVRAKGLGSQDAVAAGGRYDHLVEDFGGPSMGAFGFAAGIERILLSAASDQVDQTNHVRKGLYMAIAQSDLITEGLRFVQQLRDAGVPAVLDYNGRSLKAQLREADKALVRFVAILGEAEMKQGALTIKDLEQGIQESVSFEKFVDTMKQKIGKHCH